MKALREIGLNKLFKYVIYSFWQFIFDLLLFPNFRVLWMRLFGAKIGNDTIINKIHLHNLYHVGLKNIQIGSDCFIADTVSLDLAEKIIIGDQVNIGEGSIFSTHLKIGYKNHPLQKYFPIKKAPIIVEEGAFIGVGSIVLSGSHIGKFSFVVPGTVVAGKVPDWKVVQTNQVNRMISITTNT